MRHNCFLLLVLLIAMVGCGGNSPTTSTPTTPTQPANLQMQGNWYFALSNGTQQLVWAEEVFEKTPTQITSPGGLGIFQSAPGPLNRTSIGGSVLLGGTANPNGTLSLEAKQSCSPCSGPFDLLLSGTLATDQQHASGTWAVPNQLGAGSPIGGSGTWSAHLIAPVTGTFKGTLQESLDSVNPIPGSTPVQMTAQLTENTDTTSLSFGQLTGSLTITGACTATITLAPSENNVLHVGFFVQIIPTAVDTTNGTSLTMISVDVDDPTSQTIRLSQDRISTGEFESFGQLVLKNGPCGTRTFIGTLTKV